jgi:hypothetical protein
MENVGKRKFEFSLFVVGLWKKISREKIGIYSGFHKNVASTCRAIFYTHKN